MLEENIAEKSRVQGQYLMDLLEELKGSHPGITDVRGRGLMIGVEFNSDIASLNTEGLEKGILLNVIQGHILRVAPPLVITRAQIDEAIEKIHAILMEKGL